MMQLSELQKQYSEKLIEITDADEACAKLMSKASACWGNGGAMDERHEWMNLAHYSPSHKGDDGTILVCKKSLIEFF